MPTIRGAVLLLGLSLLASSVWSADLALATAERKTIADTYVADARIEAVHRATIAAETTGRIKEILFDVDDVVNQGSVLLRFTDKEQRAGLARAEAGLKEAEARLRQAEEEQARVKSVYAKKLVAKSALDKAEADLKAAQQRVKAAEAEVKQAREQLEYTVVRAPYAGIVVERHVNVGERVSPGAPLMTGFSLDKLRATASVPQALVEQVRQHGTVTITVGEQPDAPQISSEAITIYPYADDQTHGFTVRAELASVPQGVYPGMFAKAAFVVGEQSHLFVPRSAVVHRSEVTAVYVVDAQGRIGFRAVRAGRVLDDQVAILAGLSAGEQVALDPVRAGMLLKEGQTTGQGQ
jgi:RND family efflux transporter MFP subunit